MKKFDFKKANKKLYSGKIGRFDIVDVPALPYLMIDGVGSPNISGVYGQAISALYALSYGLKFHSKIELGKDYVVAPLEGLWWADDMSVFASGDKDKWQWTMMMRQPVWATAPLLADIRAVSTAKNAKKKTPPTDAQTLAKVRLEVLTEGTCVQTLYVGPYDKEGETLRAMHSEFIPQNNMTMTGKHHEIYLNDPRKISPEKLKTILRQPVEVAEG
ncbi:MAG: GyrI-like domain-containing protein [Robiginitomaculum sp.]